MSSSPTPTPTPTPTSNHNYPSLQSYRPAQLLTQLNTPAPVTRLTFSRPPTELASVPPSPDPSVVIISFSLPPAFTTSSITAATGSINASSAPSSAPVPYVSDAQRARHDSLSRQLHAIRVALACIGVLCFILMVIALRLVCARRYSSKLRCAPKRVSTDMWEEKGGKDTKGSTESSSFNRYIPQFTDPRLFEKPDAKSLASSDTDSIWSHHPPAPRGGPQIINSLSSHGGIFGRHFNGFNASAYPSHASLSALPPVEENVRKSSATDASIASSPFLPDHSDFAASISLASASLRVPYPFPVSPAYHPRASMVTSQVRGASQAFTHHTIDTPVQSIHGSISEALSTISVPDRLSGTIVWAERLDKRSLKSTQSTRSTIGARWGRLGRNSSRQIKSGSTTTPPSLSGAFQERDSMFSFGSIIPSPEPSVKRSSTMFGAARRMSRHVASSHRISATSVDTHPAPSEEAIKRSSFAMKLGISAETSFLRSSHISTSPIISGDALEQVLFRSTESPSNEIVHTSDIGRSIWSQLRQSQSAPTHLLKRSSLRSDSSGRPASRGSQESDRLLQEPPHIDISTPKGSPVTISSPSSKDSLASPTLSSGTVKSRAPMSPVYLSRFRPSPTSPSDSPEHSSPVGSISRAFAQSTSHSLALAAAIDALEAEALGETRISPLSPTPTSSPESSQAPVGKPRIDPAAYERSPPNVSMVMLSDHSDAGLTRTSYHTAPDESTPMLVAPISLFGDGPPSIDFPGALSHIESLAVSSSTLTIGAPSTPGLSPLLIHAPVSSPTSTPSSPTQRLAPSVSPVPDASIIELQSALQEIQERRNEYEQDDDADSFEGNPADLVRPFRVSPTLCEGENVENDSFVAQYIDNSHELYSVHRDALSLSAGGESRSFLPRPSEVALRALEREYMVGDEPYQPHPRNLDQEMVAQAGHHAPMISSPLRNIIRMSSASTASAASDYSQK